MSKRYLRLILEFLALKFSEVYRIDFIQAIYIYMPSRLKRIFKKLKEFKKISFLKMAQSQCSEINFLSKLSEKDEITL